MFFKFDFQSFRFGADIAFVANTCLKLLKKETMTIVGTNDEGNVEIIEMMQQFNFTKIKSTLNMI